VSIVAELVAELSAEIDVVDGMVAALPEIAWATQTPAVGWTVADQIAHLSWTDEQARLAAIDRAAFDDVLKTAWENPGTFVDDGARAEAVKPPAQLLQEWRERRSSLMEALLTYPEGAKLPWFGPPMSAASMATARLMEVWAHGLDIADALGVTTTPTGRLKSVAHLGVRTRDYAYQVNQLIPPAENFRYDLTAPDGAVWSWGPSDATQRITGSALDFCLLVTQRRNPAELDITADGDDAARWITIAQCFAGPPGAGR
jgi:uncharacterized protein (TIGR03084 family)